MTSLGGFAQAPALVLAGSQETRLNHRDTEDTETGFLKTAFLRDLCTTNVWILRRARRLW